MNNIGKKLVCVGALFIIIGLFFLIYNNYRDKKAGESSKEIVNEIYDIIDNNTQPSGDDNVDIVNVKGYDSLGVISIPSLNIELPILSQWDYDRLKVAPCVYNGSIQTNDLVICGHSYKSHFRYLYKLKKNDYVIITDLNNTKYFYQVVDSNIVDPYNVDEMLDNKYDLTLFTCINGGTARFALHLNRIK